MSHIGIDLVNGSHGVPAVHRFSQLTLAARRGAFPIHFADRTVVP
jgi:hypothetical protein